MTMLLVQLLMLPHSSQGELHSFPPASQSEYQQQYMTSLTSLAAAAANAATPRVLSAINSSTFRAQLAACCPRLVGLPAAKLLSLIEAEVAVAEITHNFGNPAPDSSTGPTTSGMAALTAVPNTWMSALRGDMNPPDPRKSNGLWQCEGGLEIGLFGMKGFSKPSPDWMKGHSGVGWPASVTEAADRPVYGIWNLWKQSMPGRMYGSTALVLRNSVVQAATFTVPMDSGAWIQVCNATQKMSQYQSVCNPLSWGSGTELLQNASACLCDGNSGHDLAWCEAAQRQQDPESRSSGLRSRNPLCVWSNGSVETLWQCPGGLQESGCLNGTVVTRPAPAGSPKTNGSCSLLPGLTKDSKDAAGRNLWLSCLYSGPGDQCGVCAAIPNETHAAQGTLTGWRHILAMSADYWQDTTQYTQPNVPNGNSDYKPNGEKTAPWHADPTTPTSLPSRLASILGRSNHAHNRSQLSHGVDRGFLEADVVANITYAAGVKFMLADFPTLFGTAHGVELQVSRHRIVSTELSLRLTLLVDSLSNEVTITRGFMFASQSWATKIGWALVWSLPYQEGSWGAKGFPGGVGTDVEDQRLLDLSFMLANNNTKRDRPSTIAANLSAIDVNASNIFMEHWAAVYKARGEQPPPDPTQWGVVFKSIAGSLPGAVSLYPLSATSCADVDNCIGVASGGGGDCVCYSPR